jgi:hypothetical protein
MHMVQLSSRGLPPSRCTQVEVVYSHPLWCVIARLTSQGKTTTLIQVVPRQGHLWVAMTMVRTPSPPHHRWMQGGRERERECVCVCTCMTRVKDQLQPTRDLARRAPLGCQLCGMDSSHSHITHTPHSDPVLTHFHVHRAGQISHFLSHGTLEHAAVELKEYERKWVEKVPSYPLPCGV